MNKKRSDTKEQQRSPKIILDSFCQWDGDTLVLNILGTPGAKKDSIGKVQGDQLRVSVTALPFRGRATDYMVRFLAEHFDVPVSQIEVVFGRCNVNKQLRIKSPKKLPPVIEKHFAPSEKNQLTLFAFPRRAWERE